MFLRFFGCGGENTSSDGCAFPADGRALTAAWRPLECARAHEYGLSTGRLCNTHQPKVGQRNAAKAGCRMEISDLAGWVCLHPMTKLFPNHTYPGRLPPHRFEFFRMLELE